MTELKFLAKLLARVKPQDEQVAKARAYVEKDLAQYEARKGQLLEQYDADLGYW